MGGIDGVTINAALIFGHIAVNSWIEWRGDVGYGMGRIREYDASGKCVRDETTETGARLEWAV